MVEVRDEGIEVVPRNGKGVHGNVLVEVLETLEILGEGVVFGSNGGILVENFVPVITDTEAVILGLSVD